MVPYAMKATIIQPPYSNDPADADRLFDFKLRQLAACDASDDLVVLPEYSDVPSAPTTATSPRSSRPARRRRAAAAPTSS